MGQFVIRQSVAKMKMLIVLALAACAVAEPEADPYYNSYYSGYGGYGRGVYGYSGIGYGHGSYGYSGLHRGYGGYGVYGRYGKRSAEAEPYLSVYGVGHHGVYGVSHYGGYASVSPSASVHISGLAPAAVPVHAGLYAGAGRYIARSGNTVHVAKRELRLRLIPTISGDTMADS